MSSDLQVVLWVIGILVVLVVPVACWGISSVISLRSEVAEDQRKIKLLGSGLRRLTRFALDTRDREILESYLMRLICNDIHERCVSPLSRIGDDLCSFAKLLDPR